MSCIQLRLTLLLLSYIVLIQISIDVSMLEKKYHQMVGKEKEKKKKKKRERERGNTITRTSQQTERQTDFLSNGKLETNGWFLEEKRVSKRSYTTEERLSNKLPVFFFNYLYFGYYFLYTSAVLCFSVFPLFVSFH